MRTFFLLVAVLVGCDEHQVVVAGCGDVDVNNDALQHANADGDLVNTVEGVVDTCDDHLPCTVDIQCTPCSAVPESIQYIKATCTPDEKLSPFCFDSMTGHLVYTGCTHFIQDPTPPGTINACFPVRFPSDPKSEAHAGVCDAYGVCIENP